MLSHFKTALVASLVLPLTVACGGGSSSGSSDNESGTTIKVSFNTASQVVDESSGVIAVLVVLSSQADEVVTVDVGLGAGSADLSDFQLITPLVTFAIGETVQPALVEVFADTDCEPQETLRLLLGGPTNAEIGAIFQHDVTITGSILELEPNEETSEAIGNGSFATLGPGITASLCGAVIEVGGLDDFDVHMFDVAQDSSFTFELFNDDPDADYIVLLTELTGQVFQVLDLNGAGAGESTVFERLAGESFLVSVSMVDPNSAGNPLVAEYEVFIIGATPSPLVPPAPDDDQALAELIAEGADWRALVDHAAARDEPLFARR